jgi:hypothetical protein
MADPFLVTVSAVLVGNGLSVMFYWAARELHRDENTGRKRGIRSNLWTFTCVVVPVIFLVYGAALN